MPKDHKTVAVIVVQSSRAFVWLGHMPIMNWSVRRLNDVRGIDRIVCVVSPRLKAQATKLLNSEEIEVVSMPPAVAKATQADFDKWLCSATGPAAEADVILVLQPTSPFMPASKIEAVLDRVVTKAADRCCTTREVQAYVRTHLNSPINRMLANVEVSTCRAFAPARVIETPNKFSPIHVDLVESLDVSIPDNLRVATALVANGTV